MSYVTGLSVNVIIVDCDHENERQMGAQVVVFPHGSSKALLH